MSNLTPEVHVFLCSVFSSHNLYSGTRGSSQNPPKYISHSCSCFYTQSSTQMHSARPGLTLVCGEPLGINLPALATPTMSSGCLGGHSLGHSLQSPGPWGPRRQQPAKCTGLRANTSIHTSKSISRFSGVTDTNVRTTLSDLTASLIVT